MPYNNSHIKGWVRLFIFIIIYLFFGVLFYFIGKLLIGAETLKNPQDVSLQERWITSGIDLIAFFCTAWICMKFIDQESFANLGFKIKNRMKEIITGLLLGGGIMGFAYVSLLMGNQIVFKSLNFNFQNLFYLLLLYTIVSVKEELVFRGYFLRNLMYSFGIPIALVASSVFFALVHGFNPNINMIGYLNLTLAGIMLGLPYVYDKNLWLPIALHFSWNFFQSLFGFNVSGIKTYSIIEFSKPEDNIINGGSFGFEGSVISVIIQVLVILSLYFWYERKKNIKTQHNIPIE
jgi:membrane protease YdiL (CAAX protease family)